MMNLCFSLHTGMLTACLFEISGYLCVTYCNIKTAAGLSAGLKIKAKSTDKELSGLVDSSYFFVLKLKSGNMVFHSELFSSAVFPSYNNSIRFLADELAATEEWDYSDSQVKTYPIST